MPEINSFLAYLIYIFDQVVSFSTEILAFVFFNGDVIIQKTFIFIILSIALSLVFMRLINSSGRAMFVALAASAIGVSALPNSVVLLILSFWTPVYVAIFASLIFFLATIFFSTDWRIRRFLLIVLLSASLIKWFYYEGDIAYAGIAIIAILLLVFDRPIHLLLIKIREKVRKSRIQSVRERIKAKKEAEAIELGATMEEAEEYGEEESS